MQEQSALPGDVRERRGSPGRGLHETRVRPHAADAVTPFCIAHRHGNGIAFFQRRNGSSPTGSQAEEPEGAHDRVGGIDVHAGRAGGLGGIARSRDAAQVGREVGALGPDRGHPVCVACGHPEVFMPSIVCQMDEIMNSPAFANLRKCAGSSMPAKVAAASKRQQDAWRSEVRSLLADAIKNKTPNRKLKAKLISLQSKHLNSKTSQGVLRSTVKACQLEIRAALDMLATFFEKECKQHKNACSPAKHVRSVLNRKRPPSITEHDYKSMSKLFV